LLLLNMNMMIAAFVTLTILLCSAVEGAVHYNADPTGFCNEGNTCNGRFQAVF